MLTYKIHILRHVRLTQANLEGRYIGRSDPPLCEQAARGAWSWLPDANIRLYSVYTSPLLRARQTAEMIYPGQSRRRTRAAGA